MEELDALRKNKTWELAHLQGSVLQVDLYN
jgi:hypothetical protein